jgi:hypothetical protein
MRQLCRIWHIPWGPIWGRGAPGRAARWKSGGRELLVRVVGTSVAAAVAGLTAISLCAWMMHGSEPASADSRAAAERLASGENTFESRFAPPATDGRSYAPTATAEVAFFDDRFAFYPPDPTGRSLPSASFEDRFGAAAPSGSVAVKTVAAAPPKTATVAGAPARAPSLAAAAPATRSIVAQGATDRPAARYRLASLSDTPLPAAYAPADTPDANPLAGDISHTAIYDISAHTVYLPNGERLEAHSGLGGFMDDVRSVHLRKRGPTPPNVYELKLRESRFHGVQAIRLNPVDASKMYGRDGILAHPFMLGPDGQSNGCLSLKDYPAFLNAYLRGEITRLVVVEQLDDPPSARTAADWFSDTLKKIFGRS